MLAGLFQSSTELAMMLVAVTLLGLSKGGLGGMSLLAVPILALVMPPVTAAAILLPVMLVMDVVSVVNWRKWVNWGILWLVMPGALLGIGIGWATAELVSDAAVKLIVGLVSVGFVLRVIIQRRAGPVMPGGRRPLLAQFWGSVAGYTSFVAHAGSPPLQIYMIPLKLDPRIFTGTTVMFFAITNALKVIPYFALGQLGAENLLRSIAMVPLAIASTWAGAYAVRRMRTDIFYAFTYVSVALVGMKLIWDGLAGL